MSDKEIEIKSLSSKNAPLLKELEKHPRLKAYWKAHEALSADFNALLNAKKHKLAYWVCLASGKPQALILTADMTQEQPDYMVPWMEPERKTIWLSLIPLSKEGEKSEVALEHLSQFVSTLSKEVGTVLVDPEVQEEFFLALYEQAGFVKVSTFIKGQGFFKGTAHYLMKLKT